MTDPAGSDTQIQYNNSGVFGASSALTWSDDDPQEFAVVTSGDVTFLVGGSENEIFMRDAGGEAGQALLIVSGGALTAVDQYYAGFTMANGTATFMSGPNEGFYDASIVADFDTASVTVNAAGSSNPYGAFQVDAGKCGLDTATSDAVFVMGKPLDGGGSSQYLDDVAFDTDFSPWAGTTVCQNGLIFTYAPGATSPNPVAQATFADAYGGQLVISNGQPLLYDWRFNLGGGGSVIYVGQRFPADDEYDTYTGLIHLLAESDDDAAAEEITLTPGTGTNINCQKLGFFGTAPVGIQLGANYTGTATGDNADMLNFVYAALLAYGLVAIE